MSKSAAAKFKVEIVPLKDLRPHPRNYREHTEEQLTHIIASLKEHGFYRNIVIAREGTILAGHGVVEALSLMGLKVAPVYRLAVGPSDPKALKVLTGDNEIARMAMIDDRALTEILKEIRDEDPVDLLGTGYDDQMLAALTLVTRPASEIASFDEAAEWVGMPDYGGWSDPLKLIISFANEKDRDAFVKHAGLTMSKAGTGRRFQVWSAWWPAREKQDPASVEFQG